MIASLQTYLRRPSSADSVMVVTYGSALLGIVASPVVARSLGPADRGLAAALTATAGLMVLIGNLGVDSALLNAKVERRLSHAACNGVAARFSTAWGPVASVVFIAIALEVSGDASGSVRAGIAAGAVLVPFGFWGNWCYKSALVQGHLRAIATHRFFIVGGPAVAGTALASVGALTPSTYLVGFVVCNLVGIAALTLALDVQFDRSSRVRRELAFGLRATVGALASSVNHRVDQVLLVPLAGSEEAGLYVISVTLASLLMAAASAIGSVSVGQMVTPEGVDLTIAARYVRLALVVSSGLAVVIAAGAMAVLTVVYGDEFAGSLIPLLVLLPGVVIWSGGLSFSDTFSAVGRPGAFSLIELVGTCATVLGLFALAPRYGATGAAIVSTSVYFAVRLAEVKILRRRGLGSVRPTAEDVSFVVNRQLELVRRLVAGVRRV